MTDTVRQACRKRTPLDGVDAQGPEGRRLAVSLSGGKDSVATALLLRELGLEHRLIHADTEWEHPAHYEYMEYLHSKLGPITIVRGPGFEQLVLSRGMFPCRVRRFCTQELKIWPQEEVREDDEVVVLGVRREESAARSRLPAVSVEKDHTIWRPLIDWSADRVWAILARHAIKPHPLYALGARRVGCWPCIFAGRKDLRLLETLSPERVAYIADLERRVQQVAWVRGRNSIPTWGTIRRPGSNRHEAVAFSELMGWACSERGRFKPSPQACLMEGICE
jgi:3'-phosphoadenosine 5'-phosphosulfate sulfotransferase (PAPS reductase)/FAD synthetase